MHIRDRIRELRRVRAGDLQPHPRNWRTHPPAQRDALRGILAEIGYADALLARELADGSLQLIDGHLRAETTPDVEVPVLVVDLTEEEADTLLAVLDPLAGMAEPDAGALADLVSRVETSNAALRGLLDACAASSAVDADDPSDDASDTHVRPDLDIPDAWQVLVECRDEVDQRAVYERLTAEGYECKVLTV